MTTIKTEGLTFLQKLKHLQDIMGEYAWEKDGINRHQSYKYVTEKQYKHNRYCESWENPGNIRTEKHGKIVVYKGVRN